MFAKWRIRTTNFIVRNVLEAVMISPNYINYYKATYVLILILYLLCDMNLSVERLILSDGSLVYMWIINKMGKKCCEQKNTKEDGQEEEEEEEAEE